MHGIMEMAQEFNTSKGIILRAAINIGLYDPISNKKSKFDNDEKSRIKNEVKKIKTNSLLKNINKIKREPSDNFIDISENWIPEMSLNIKNSDLKYKAVDLFSGAGGIALGILNEGFRPIINSEIFPEAIQTYKNMFGKIIGHNITPIDVNDTDMLKKSIGSNEIDLLVGGFPCQGFSVAGIRSESDPRNQLYEKMFNLVKRVQPKVVVMENVVGLLTAKYNDKTMLIDRICEIYENEGYEINYAVLNAADYGAPQLRKRVILIANNIGVDNLFPKPILNQVDYVTVKEALHEYEQFSGENDPNFIRTAHKKETLKKMSKLKFGESLYKTFSDAWKKLDPDKPSGTIKENHGGVNIHYNQNRVLTPREMATLQTFPNDFIFSGNKSKQLVQIGNAVPPVLAKAIAHCVKLMLESKK